MTGSQPASSDARRSAHQAASNRRDLAIVGGTVVPAASSAIPNGTVLVQAGRIAAVGPSSDIAVPGGTPTLHATGRWVLPGFVEAHSHLGIDEEASGWAGDDLNEKTDPNGARLRAIDGINPADLGFADALAGGVTTAVVLPGSANPIGGQTAAVKCWGATLQDMLVKDFVALKGALGENPKRVYSNLGRFPSTRLGTAASVRDAFTAAEVYRERAASATGSRERDPAMDALVHVLDREVPFCQHVHRADDIETALRLADEFGYRLVIEHGTEAHLIVDLIAAKGVPVISGPLIGTRTKLELRNRSRRSPALLASAGVEIALTTDHNEVPIDFLVHQATFAIKEGLSRATALRAITSSPAQILGLNHRVGDLLPGLDGDVVVWSGDPFDVMSRAMQVVIQGRLAYEWDETAGTGHVAAPRPSRLSSEDSGM